MIQMLKHPPRGFEEAVRDHFLLKGRYIKRQIQGWIADAARFSDSTTHRAKLRKLLSEFEAELQKLDSREGVWADTGGEEKETETQTAEGTGNKGTPGSPTVESTAASVGTVPPQAIEETYSYQTYPF